MKFKQVCPDSYEWRIYPNNIQHKLFHAIQYYPNSFKKIKNF